MKVARRSAPTRSARPRVQFRLASTTTQNSRAAPHDKVMAVRILARTVSPPSRRIEGGCVHGHRISKEVSFPLHDAYSTVTSVLGRPGCGPRYAFHVSK